jgi:hypothetical protein
LDKWRHLFVDGEFAERARIVSGLTLEQATHRPSPQSHTIHEELWHTTRWQNIVVNRDEELYKSWQGDDLYPPGPPASEAEWSALVAEFLAGLERALECAHSPEKLGKQIDPDYTMGDALYSLAVHNAYHLGKVVALRQFLGAWPPKTQKENTDA